MKNQQRSWLFALTLAVVLTIPGLLPAQNSFPGSGDAFIANSDRLNLSRNTSSGDVGFLYFGTPYSNMGWGWPDRHERALVFQNSGYTDAYEAGGGGFLFITTRGDDSSLNALSIRRDGKVGIGTIQPSAKLTVNGTAKAKQIIVEENMGADFVFAEDYRLPELQEVETYIRQHRHLPEVPPARAMIREGVNVGELQMKLLQKIEELTLYVIELEKRTARQQKHIEALEGNKSTKQ